MGCVGIGYCTREMLVVLLSVALVMVHTMHILVDLLFIKVAVIGWMHGPTQDH